MQKKINPHNEFGPGAESVKLTGNYAAKLQADKIEIPEIPFSSDDYFDNCKLLPTIYGEYGGRTPKEWALDIYGLVPTGRTSSVVLKEKKERFKDYIKAGHIDPKTMGWVNTLRGHDNKVCICLNFNCRIGPFIPVRKSVDK